MQPCGHQPSRAAAWLTDDDWRLSFAANIDAVFHLCQAALPAMIAQDGGAVVDADSQWGLHPAPIHIAYNATRAAAASSTQNLARNSAPHNIRVNAARPGKIHTPMPDAGVKRSGRTIADLDTMVPLGRMGMPEEVTAFKRGSLVEITGARAVA